MFSIRKQDDEMILNVKEYKKVYRVWDWYMIHQNFCVVLKIKLLSYPFLESKLPYYY